jgi:hypothetical protein
MKNYKPKGLRKYQNCIGPKWNYRMKLKEEEKERKRLKKHLKNVFNIDEETSENFLNYYGKK